MLSAVQLMGAVPVRTRRFLMHASMRSCIFTVKGLLVVAPAGTQKKLFAPGAGGFSVGSLDSTILHLDMVACMQNQFQFDREFHHNMHSSLQHQFASQCNCTAANKDTFEMCRAILIMRDCKWLCQCAYSPHTCRYMHIAASW